MKDKGELKRAVSQGHAYTRVVEQIQQLLKSGDLAPGDQLLPERQLAEKLGVSRSSAREALAMLVGMGVVEVSPRDGAYIRRRSLDDMAELLAQVLYQEREQIAYLFEVRLIIETQAARLAALRRSEADVIYMHSLNRQVAEDVEIGRPADESDTRFHVAIVEATQNPLLTKVMGSLVTALMEVYAPARRQILANRVEGSPFVHEHEQILDAIVRQDAEAAAHLVQQHIDHARQRLQALEGEHS